MIKWILQDVKRTLKSRKTFLLLAVVTISIIALLTQSFNKYNPGNFEQESHDSRIHIDTSTSQIYNLQSAFDYECVTYEQLKNSEYAPEELTAPDKDCSDYLTYLELMNQFEAIGAENLEENYALQLHILDISTDSFMNYYDESNDTMKASLQEKLIDINMIKEIKTYVKENLSDAYPSFKLDDKVRSTSIFNERAVSLYEVYISYVNNYPLDLKIQVTSSFFIANYLNEFFLLLVVVGILVVFDSIYRDYQSGVIKTILSSPTRRFRYIIMKTLSSIISVSFIILLPLLLTGLGLYLYNGYDSSHFPIYISRTTLNSFDPVLKYSRFISAEKPAAFFSTYKNVCTIAPVSKFPVDITAAAFDSTPPCTIPYANIDIVSLSKYISMLFGYFLFIIVFISTLNTLFSLVFHNQVMNLIGLMIVVGLSVSLNTLLIGNPLLKVLPLTFMSPSSLLMGTTPYTFLNGLVTLSVWIIILNLLNYVILKKKDFSY